MSNYQLLNPRNKSGLLGVILYSPLFFFLFSAHVNAEISHLHAMQMPAWLERNGRVSALKPGMELHSGDTITTGATGRVLLHMGEGSLLKLGEDAKLYIDVLSSTTDSGEEFKLVVNIYKGAIRYTTAETAGGINRQVSVQIGDISTQLNTSDIWGNAKTDKDILCLIEGDITVQSTSESELSLHKAGSYYELTKDQVAQPVDFLTQQALEKRISLTELENGSGVLAINGGWAINLMSLAGEMNANNIMKSLTSAGYPVEVEAIDVNGQDMYRLRINGFESIDDARAFADNFEGVGLIEHPWVVPL